MKTWTNERGETVVDDGVRLRVISVRNVDGTQAQNATAGSLTEQVARDLAKPENRGVIAAVDEELGIVAAITPPVDPYAGNFAPIAELRRKVHEAETALRHAVTSRASGTEQRRLEQQVETARREHHAAEHALEVERSRQRGER